MFLEFYGISEQPFGVTPDPRFLYMAPAYQEAFASLVYGIEAGRGFMALIAAPGLGKTTLVMRLMETLQKSAQTAFLFQTHTSSQEFIKNLLLDLHVEPTGNDLSDLQAQLQQVLLQGMNSGKRLVLVIDEAQNLDDSVLEMVRMLSNFETPQAKLLQIILVGQPALANKLMQPNLSQLRQRISIIAYFSPLRGREIMRYIQFRLGKAGFKGHRLFTSRALALIAAYSRGIPRNINNLCFNALSLGFAKGEKTVDEPIIREVIGDLKLEVLGESTSTPGLGVKPTDSSAAAKSGAHPPSPPAGNHYGVLDDIDISDDSPVVQRGNERHPGRSSRAWVLVALALAAICALAWRGGWLKPASNFVVEAMGRVPASADRSQNPSVSHPPDASAAQGVAAAGSSDPNSAADNTPGAPAGTAEDSHSTAGETSMPSRSADGSAGIPGEPGDASKNLAAEQAANPAAAGVFATKLKPATAPVPVNAGDEDLAGAVQGRLVVESSESGAQISVNGRSDQHWVTPHLFRLADGTYDVSISKGGYVNWNRRVHVTAGREQWLMADLQSQMATGLFIVDTEPSGMAVFIDGKLYGHSRVEAVLSAGWHVCEVVPGPGLRPVTGRFHLDAGSALTKTIRITSAPATRTPSGPSNATGGTTAGPATTRERGSE